MPNRSNYTRYKKIKRANGPGESKATGRSENVKVRGGKRRRRNKWGSRKRTIGGQMKGSVGGRYL